MKRLRVELVMEEVTSKIVPSIIPLLVAEDIPLWETNKLYRLRDQFLFDGIIYITVIEHTSTSFASDREDGYTCNAFNMATYATKEEILNTSQALAQVTVDIANDLATKTEELSENLAVATLNLANDLNTKTLELAETLSAATLELAETLAQETNNLEENLAQQLTESLMLKVDKIGSTEEEPITGDLEFAIGKGIILKSENGSRCKITLNNNGTLNITQISNIIIYWDSEKLKIEWDGSVGECSIELALDIDYQNIIYSDYSNNSGGYKPTPPLNAGAYFVRVKQNSIGVWSYTIFNVN